VFLHGAVTGLLMLSAVASYSRIGLLLAGIGALVAAGVRATLRIDVPWSAIDLTASFNAMLVAMALGGVWFVPHPTSLALAAAGAAVSCVLTYALVPVAGLFALPVLSLPFVATTHLFLTAARVRERDRWPHSAPEADRPEEALALHLMRARRFGQAGRLPFRLPFRGTWMVTQGHDGSHTHKGPWRYALDFEGRAADGRAFDHDGSELRHYRCYALPVLAAAPGIVDEVIDGVPDNPPGQLDTRQNWGNAVVISHGAGLFSVYAHLQPRSIRVRRGDGVVAGAQIGRCGNSGRSSVPHLHFQVQRGAPLGSETVSAEFGDVVVRLDGISRLVHHSAPAEGDVLRPVSRDEAVARVLALPPGTAWIFSAGAGGARERAVVEVDLWGRHVLRSESVRMYFEPYDAGLVVTAFEGRADSLMRHMVLSLSRVTFDQESELVWSDRLPRRLFLPRWTWAAADLAAAIAPRVADITMTYRSRRTESRLVIDGSAGRFSTRATIDLGEGSHRFELIRDHHHTAVELSRERSQSEGARA
jgi:murein DD-endopeptidase MepM/ murein hydrolase activator NlpD